MTAASQIGPDLLFEVVLAVDTVGRVPVDQIPGWLRLLDSSVDPQEFLSTLIGDGYVLRPEGENGLYGPLGRGRKLLRDMPDRVGRLATILWRENKEAEASLTSDHTTAICACETTAEARRVLIAEPFGLTADQANHLLVTMQLQCLTQEHRRTASEDASRDSDIRTPPAEPWEVERRPHVVAELQLLDEAPEHVCGENAFVLFQPQVGRVEVGNPLPDDDIWNHLSGDLRYTVVASLSGGLAGGGGRPWDSEELDWSYREPGTSTNPSETAYIVIGQIPPEFTSVQVLQGRAPRTQTPINRTAVLPLDNKAGHQITVFGVDATGERTVLFKRP